MRIFKPTLDALLEEKKSGYPVYIIDCQDRFTLHTVSFLIRTTTKNHRDEVIEYVVETGVFDRRKHTDKEFSRMQENNVRIRSDLVKTMDHVIVMDGVISDIVVLGELPDNIENG